MYSRNDYRYYLEHRLAESDDYLAHYGVKGMKWKKHKQSSELRNYNDRYVTDLRVSPKHSLENISRSLPGLAEDAAHNTKVKSSKKYKLQQKLKKVKRGAKELASPPKIGHETYIDGRNTKVSATMRMNKSAASSISSVTGTAVKNGKKKYDAKERPKKIKSKYGWR